jgi:hypothetical protein
LEIVRALLGARGLNFSDLTRATAYLKHGADAPAISEIWTAAGIKLLPLLVSKCDICREELLFELEAEAWKPAR